MKDGKVVVLSDGVIGTVIGKISEDGAEKLQVVTNKGYIRYVSPSEVYEWQEGIESKEENDVGSKSQGEAAPSKRKGSGSRA
jgi:hypothetical protein